MNEGLAAGAYESLRTHGLDRALGVVPHASPQFGEVEPAEAPEVLARHIADAVRQALQDEPHHQRLEKINDRLAQVTDDDGRSNAGGAPRRTADRDHLAIALSYAA